MMTRHLSFCHEPVYPDLLVSVFIHVLCSPSDSVMHTIGVKGELSVCLLC